MITRDSENTFIDSTAGSQETLRDRNHIVCGIDFNEDALGAADVAGELAKARSEPLLLTHVINAPARDSLPEDLRDTLALFERKQLHDEKQRLTESGAIVYQQLLTGAPDHALREVTRAPAAHLLVI